MQRETLQQLLERTADFLLIVDETGRIQFADETLESVLGYEPADIVGDPLASLLVVETVTPELDAVDSLDIPFAAADGSTVHTSVSTASTATDGTVCLVRDVTDSVERTRTLDRYVQLVESVGDPMYVLDEEGTIELVNDAMVEYTGYPEDELVGQSIGTLIPPLDRIQMLHDPHDWTGDTAETIEATLVAQSGEVVLSEANITPLRDEDGTISGTVGVLRDIRERKRRQQDLELLKQVLTRVFRHNIRNELMVIQGFTDLIESTVDADIDGHLAEIDQAIDTLLEYGDKARKIEDVMESPGLTETTLEREIEMALSTIREAYPDARIAVEDLPDTPIEAHPKITTAIEELLDNALRHTPDDRDSRIHIWADSQDDSVTLFIEDNAGGLEDNEIGVLEQGTETDLEHSSGVGLWLVQWIVDYSDAELVVNRTDDGTLMGIRFT
jgi:PAS domain S-box-containing protein